MKQIIPTFCLAVWMALLISSCQTRQNDQTTSTELKTGTWRGVIKSPGGELPFGLDISKKDDSTYQVYVINSTERLKMDDAILRNDSLHIPMRLFDAEIIAHVGDSVLTGYYTKQSSNRIVKMDFSAQPGVTYRFATTSEAPKTNITGKWDVYFYGDSDTSQAVGVFNQNGAELTGSFLTPTGDYRYLAGSAQGNTFQLSTFDGSHVYLFKGTTADKGNEITGEFWSGDRGYRKWKAIKNEKAALPDANTYTLLKKGYSTIDFTFPDPTGKNISFQDPKYKNKVVIVQILGSWCPNCMDETNFLAPWYKKNKDRGVEIVGLAFEKSNDLKVSGPKIERMKQRFGMEYDVALAGVNDSTASKSLPMLEKIKGYPTTIFIDKKGKVRRIHTGFNGPGTGKYYDEFVEDFTLFTDKLLAE
ncbi:TlpA disulfide reductase family protein [Cytophagaceae bacterium DM2B3-1]|uniref:TlpA disulfide reductase family protein n=1 Tax=Xanthocytophaga flava TaxID=3048013 RepID=A0ABT7CQ70_9BACT|nr:TlpA disulfide reductase family protein [Xanthocytophaga flavus]MDJ1495901.1 TlpA disulfide reductase family protein [Xanthocytophaga flavus]